MQKILYSRREVAALIGLSVPSVEALTQSGQLPTVKIGRSVRVNIHDLQEFCRKGTQNLTVKGKELDPLWLKKQGRSSLPS
ncbi:MAG TPA: helix-turn-helix domain-containing protein [Terracidiphilus sp.]|jgi:excisionase family DNA binding protein